MKKVLLSSMIVFMLMLLAACGQSENTSDSGSESGNEDPKQEKKEELTALQVIEKSGKTMQNWPGMEYSMDLNQNITATKGDQTKKMKTQMTMDTKMKMDPMSMYMSGQTKANGQTIPVENYYLDGTMYTKTPQETWIGIKGMNLEQMQKQSQGKNPSKTLDQFKNILKQFSDNEKSNKFVTMKKQDGMYVVTMDLNEKASQKVLEQGLKQVKDSLGSLKQMGIAQSLNKMKIKHLKQTFYIDQKTFEQNKMEQKMTMEMPMNGIKMTIDQEMAMEITGKVEKPISVPKKIKQNAKTISMKQLQKIQKQQQKQPK
ncbi:DUF6612 family protein [Virgibacillus siamensis]|uniref:DUF6612 family protein n=1 Tax=Virgibacillus siamensis TaxID=480071 RepID=UPI00098590D6|nr:DUF6612 family protein [Virgibacillus siamensis]